MDGSLSFNIPSGTGGYLCPVCGYDGFCNRPTYTEAGHGLCGSAICPCCFWEPGFDDCQHASRNAQPTVRASILAYRANWLRDPVWRSTIKPPPADFDPARQVAMLREKAGHLFD